jgi:hypothetical protein
MPIDEILNNLLYKSLLNEFSIIKFPTKGFYGDEEKYNIIPYMTEYSVDQLIKDILIDPEEKVINDDIIKICFNYPFNDEYIIEFITPNNEGGFKRKDLVRLIINQYYKMYQEEEKTSKEKVISIEQRYKTGLLNRNVTNGIYGIYGHDMEDLSLNSMIKRDDGIWNLSISS